MSIVEENPQQVLIDRLKEVMVTYQVGLSRAILNEMNADTEKVMLRLAYASARITIFLHSTNPADCLLLERNVFFFVTVNFPEGILGDLRVLTLEKAEECLEICRSLVEIFP